MILGLLTKFGIPQWAAEVLAGAAIVLALAGGGYYKGFHDKAAADELAAQKAQTAHLQELAALQAKGEALQAKFDVARAQTVIQYRDIVKEVPRVTTVYRPAPGAELRDLPACVFTRGFVGVWNSALDPGLSAAAGGAAGAAGSAGAAGAQRDESYPSPQPPPSRGGGDKQAGGGDEELPAGVSQGDVLRNHVDNAAGCTAVRQQLDALIDWHRQIGDR